MNVLLIYPKNPDNWSGHKHILSFANKKATFPPLGLMTVSSILPSNWNKKLIDLNVTKDLEDSDLEWADYVFVSAMLVQKKSSFDVIKKAKDKGKFVVAGGIMFSVFYEEFKDVDCFVLGEGEVTIPLFLQDFEKGKLKRIYKSDDKPDITKSPIPDWSLIKLSNYLSMPIQISRGCPYNCDYCDVILFNGREPRFKTTEQVIKELDALYDTGFRGGVFIVDDNFIGNKTLTKQVLNGIAKWMQEKKFPFKFHTQISVNIADDLEIIQLMKSANFGSVFVGIETVDEKSLLSIGKLHNTKIDLKEKVKIIQRNGIEVIGGFMLGFDADTTETYERMIDFINDSGIAISMAVLLVAYPNTPLYERLKSEARILEVSPEDDTNFSLNFIPRLNKDILIEYYLKVLKSIYNQKNYYNRTITFFKEYNKFSKETKMKFGIQLRLIFLVFWKLALFDKGMIYFWKMILWTLFNKPKLLPDAIRISIFGYHFRKVLQEKKDI